MPIYEKIQQELAAGSLGDIQMINASFCYQYDLEKEKDDSVLYELGIFAIQFATLAMNNERPEQIKALATLSKEGKIVTLIK